MHRLLVYVSVLMLALQLVLPGLGKAEASGTWIEICSEFGAIEIKLPAEESDSQTGDCPDCDICLTCAAEGGQTRQDAILTSTTVPARDLTGRLGDRVVAFNPAQFWHDGRGPPRQNTKNMKRACGASMATTQIMGEAS